MDQPLTGFSIFGSAKRSKDGRLRKIKTDVLSIVDRAANGRSLVVVKRRPESVTPSIEETPDPQPASLDRLSEITSTLAKNQASLSADLDPIIVEACEIVENLKRSNRISSAQLSAGVPPNDAAGMQPDHKPDTPAGTVDFRDILKSAVSIAFDQHKNGENPNGPAP